MDQKIEGVKTSIDALLQLEKENSSRLEKLEGRVSVLEANTAARAG